MNPLLLSILLLSSQVHASPETRASIIIINPAPWYGPTVVEVPTPAVVEVPTGRFASPGLIDWSNVKLMSGVDEIPFAIREGRAHWKCTLNAPVSAPAAEDLLVFTCDVPPGVLRSIHLVPGSPSRAAALAREDGRIEITYPDCRVVIDEQSGMLQTYETFGVHRLQGPLSISIQSLCAPGYEFSGAIGPGYQRASVSLLRDATLATSTRYVSSSSTSAMTEVNFEVSCVEGPTLALTYRLHRSGLLEIVSDERPWQGESPWLRRAVKYTLAEIGQVEPLPYIEDRWPFYGFREYTASMAGTGRISRMDTGSTVVLGEETVNGRHFSRRFYPVKPDASCDAMVEMADEGLIVEVTPIRVKPDKPLRLVFPETEGVIQQILAKALGEAGMVLTEDTGNAYTIRAELTPDAPGINGDGYSVEREDGGIRVRARTRLGLYGAVRAIADHLRQCCDGTLPLVARNPIVDVRAGGFGGGDFEVDFPYGTDEEWIAVFDRLLDSGMNTFACLGMWSNWKMPVSYRYMPELHSDAPDAYDESSGAKFSEFEAQRDHGLKLTRYLQDRGGKVWLWLPIGCVPTTFAPKFPDAMAPGTDKFPCFTHPEYRRYIDAFLRELVETYPIDGLVLIRDDNGGICTCDRCKKYVAESRTKSPVWEQYIQIYDWLRANNFKGDVGVYPYFDGYEPKLDPLLPSDLYVIGHGSGTAVLSRDYEHVAPMGDTWLDNLYANFRLPPSPRMRRLLADRPGFWIGGAYWGCELPWHAVGAFGWEPTMTPNSLRYEWARRVLRPRAALPFVCTSDTYERMWDINARHMLPPEWLQLSPEARAKVVDEGDALATQYRQQLADLEKAIEPGTQDNWLAHLRLFAPFFEYHLHRLDRFAAVRDQVLANRAALDTPEGLPRDVREAVLADYAEIYARAAKYNAAMQSAPPGGMMDKTRWMTKPYKEWMAGYDQWLDGQLDPKQFAGTMALSTSELCPGQPFTLRVTLHNNGLCPWITEAGHVLEFTGDAERLGLPKTLLFEGDPIAPGDTRVLEFKGTVPEQPGSAGIAATFASPYRVPDKFLQGEIKISW